MQQQQGLITNFGRITLDICANGFIVMLPGKNPMSELTESLIGAMPDMLKNLHLEDQDEQMEAIKQQLKEAEKAEQPGYKLETIKNQFVFDTLEETMKFIHNEIMLVYPGEE